MSWYHRGRFDINWRNAEWMTGVRDQGNTETCWAVAVCDLVEMLHNRQNPDNRLHSPLSAQELIDNYKYEGMDRVSWAFNYIKTNGIAYEDDYPWRGGPSEKKERRENQEIYRGVSGFKEIELGKIDQVIENHPVIGSFYLTSNFKRCRNSDIVDLEAVVTDDKGVRINEFGHAMVIVGHGQTAYFQRYLHVKNSWGEGWGDEGYARLAKSDTEPNRAFYPSFYYPLIHED